MLSIITISYNSKKSIGRTLASVAAQEDQGFEYLVIDGGSTDGTLDLVRSYGSRVNFLQSEKDRGIADALNKGVQKATGHWMFFLHSDDFLEPDATKIMNRAIQQAGDCEMISMGIRYVDANGNEISKFLPNLDLERIIKRGMNFPHTGLITKKSLFDRVGYFNEKFKIAMDYDFVLRAIRGQTKIKAEPTILNNMAITGVSALWPFKVLDENYNARVETFGPKLVFKFQYFFDYLYLNFKEILKKIPGVRFLIRVIKGVYNK